MPSIKSDLTNKVYPAKQLRQFEISDESEVVYDYSQDQGPLPNSEEMSIEAINAHLASRGIPPLDNAAQKAVIARNHQLKESRMAPPMIENQISEARRLKATGKERLSDSARKRVELLCGMFSETRTVDVDGKIFVLRTLEGDEIKKCLIAASEHVGTVALPFEHRKQYLAYSLTQVAGTEIELFLGDNSLEARLEFVSLLPEVLLGVLFTEYLTLVEETNRKYAVNSDAAAKEVAADIKK